MEHVMPHKIGIRSIHNNSLMQVSGKDERHNASFTTRKRAYALMYMVMITSVRALQRH